MNDVRSLLSEAVPQEFRTAGRWPDAGPDIARGRALLVRRRRRFALAGGTGLVALGAAGVLLTASLSPEGRSAPAAGASTAGRGAAGKAGVALVAYHGAQPKGYTLKSIPQGWEVASADSRTLVLHKIGTRKGGDWTDKIVIMGDLNPFPKSGDKVVDVDGHKGVFTGYRGEGTSITLIYKTGRKAAGTPLNVTVQLPHTLNWSVTTTVRFASGITVADGAGGAVG